jgi:hypothetical protein
MNRSRRTHRATASGRCHGNRGINSISEENQHMLGTLLVNELMTADFGRRPQERTQFLVFIGEFSHFVTKDACEILDGERKFGLHLILAHQHLGQLREKDPEVDYSTLTNARTKIVFGGPNDENVNLIAKDLFTGELDPNQVKDETWHRAFEPVESAELHNGEKSGPSKAPVPIWTRTTVAGSSEGIDRSANAPQRGGSKRAL